MGLKERAKTGEIVIGTWCLLPSPEVINVIGKTGIDFVIIDMEHGPMDYGTAQRMLMAAEAEKAEGIIRVGENDEVSILKALDIGAAGIIVPHIDSVEDCRKAIKFIKYPPQGVRGFSPYARSGNYHNEQGYTERANDEVMAGIIVEGKEGIENIGNIAEVEGLDLVYIGTYDISSMLGVPGEVTNPQVIDLLNQCVKKIKEAGKIPGCMFSSIEETKLYKKIGLNFWVYKVDSAVIYDGYKEIINKGE